MKLTAETVRNQTDIVAYISQYVSLKPDGANLTGLCPFHKERTASFKVHRVERYFKCFGCDVRGDVIAFAQKHDGISFTEALAKVGAFAGVAVSNGHHRNGTSQTKLSAESVRRTLASDGYRVVAEYRFGEHDRQVRFEHQTKVDSETSKPEKKIRWEHFDGAAWLSGKSGQTLPLYRNSVLCDGPHQQAVGVEGPGKADALAGLGIAAFDHRHFLPDHGGELAGRDVALWPDADDAGRGYANKAVGILRPHARSIAVIDPPAELGHGGDVIDALRLGWSHDRIRQLIEQAIPANNIHASDKATASRPLTEIGLAERFVDQHGGNTRYSHASSNWYIYDGPRWQEDETAEVERKAKATIRRLYQEAASEADGDRRQAIAKFAARSDSDVTIRRMLSRAAAETGIPVRPSEFDSDPALLNCANGVIDLRTGKLGPHRRELMMTKLVPVVYDPSARSATWSKFLETVTAGDSAVAEFLQTAIGYSATGFTAEEKLFFVFGPGGTGKSTFLEACKFVFGSYGWVSDFESFIQRSPGGAVRSDIAELSARRFVVSVEVDEGARLAEGLVKHLTGGDTVRARQLYQRGFEFVPQFKLWLCANHAPRVSDDDSGMWRRILRIPFENVIPVEQRDTALKARLKRDEERAAILAWIVQGAVRWFADGLAVPRRISAATEAYRQEQDPLKEFFEDVCEFDAEAWVSVASLRTSYNTYCAEAGIRRPLGPRPFNDRLRQRGVAQDLEGTGTRRIRVWRGIRVKE